MSSLTVAWRSLNRARGFTIAAILTLSIGIGSTVAVFTVLNAILIAPLPFPDADRLMNVSIAFPTMHVERGPQSIATYFAFKRFARTIDDIAVYDVTSVNLSDSSARAVPERLRAALVSANLFPMLGATLQLGRTFTESEDAPRGEPVLVISDGLWKRRFGGERSVLGTRVQIDGKARVVIGVLAPSFRFPDATTELWLPIALDPATAFAGPFAHNGFVRVRRGANVPAVERELNGLLPRAAELFPAIAPGMPMSAFLTQSGARVFLRPMRDDVVGSLGIVLSLAAGAAVLLLLISCANVASLLLTRNDARRREFAVCIALGAGRRQILTRLAGEVILLAAASGILGLGLADVGVRALVDAGPVGIPRLGEISIDPMVVAFAMATALVVALLCAIAPALRYRGDGLSAFLRDGGRGSTTGRQRQRLRGGLVVAQVAFAVVLVTGAGVLLRTVERLREVHPGFDGSHALTLWISLPSASYPNDSVVVRFTEAFLDQLSITPGVRAAGVASKLPLNPSGIGYTPIWSDNDHTPGGALPGGKQIVAATGGYFSAMGIPLVAGRTFNRAGRQTPFETVIDRAVAYEYWHDSTGIQAIGRTLKFAPSGGPTFTVVGVVGAVRDTSLAALPAGIIYLPDVAAPDSNQSFATRSLGVVVRSAGDPAALIGAVQRTLRSVDPELPAFGVATMTDVIDRSMARVSFVVALIGVAAIAALALAAIGLYGVLAYMVRLDTKEIGIRIAIGASPLSVATRITRRSAGLTAVGIAGGFALFAALSRFLGAMAFGVALMDPMIMIAAAMSLIVVALIASWFPARRAAHVDPVHALTSE